MRLLIRPLVLIALVSVLGCVSAGRPQRELQAEANRTCWQLRDSMKDWRLAATQCAQKIEKMSGVEAAWVDGNMVRVKFSDYAEQYGIWMK